MRAAPGSKTIPWSIQGDTAPMTCSTLKVTTLTSHTMRTLKQLVALAAIGLFGTPYAAGQNLAGDKPPIKLIVPYGPGTPIDVTSRLVAESIAKSLGRTVVVDNRTGAAGNLATEAVATAAPDGNTVLLTVNNTITVNPILYTKLRYDPMKDLAPVALVSKGGYLLVSSQKSGLRSVDDLIRAAKTKPANINYASYGIGSMSHVCAEMFQDMAKVKLFHVPYRVGSLTDIVGGQVDIGFEPIAPAIPFVNSSKLNALAVSSEKRVDALPNVPAVAEKFAGFECMAWVGVFVPARTPTEVRSAIESAVVRVASSPEFAKVASDMGGIAQAAGTSEFAKLVREDHEKWSRILKPLNLKLD